MEPPECQFCGKKEWRHVCGKLGIIQPSKIAPVGVEKTKSDVGHSLGETPKEFDRKTYQREYMRVYRRKKK